MSVAQHQISPPDRGASPLMSNNPFRNRVTSQISPQPSPQPRSTNPFLDATEIGMAIDANQQAATANNSVDKTTDVFASLDVTHKQNDLTKIRSRPTNGGLAPRRPDNTSHQGFPRPPGHRPTTSNEDRKRLQTRTRPELDIFADPFDVVRPQEKSRKPRRNSETSVMDKTSSLDPEEERKRRERKHRESKKPGSKSSSKPSKKLDIIDKLDVTSIYGTGLFHHDGPFDACNPHRNRRKEKYAPIQAFPKDSVNMIMGGSGPLNKTIDYNKFHGYGEEAHRDFNEAAVVEDDKLYGYNPNARDQLHGDESAGLGTSTFLEGAPASRTAMQRRESENDAQVDDRPGLSRKKSLAQRIRGVRPNRDRFASPDSRNGAVSPRVLTGQSENAENPFFKDVNGTSTTAPPVKDGTTITFDEQPKPTRPRAPSSPKRNELERRNTTESVPEETTSKPSGLLGRMKSLKGGRRPNPRRDTSG